MAPGIHPVRVTITDVLGRSQICGTIVTVLPNLSAGLQCPLDIVTNCSPAGGQSVFFMVSLCNSNFTVTSVPPSESLFPAGVTTVVTTAKNSAGLTETCMFKVTVNCAVTLHLSAPGLPPTIDWTGPGFLDQAAKVTGPWTRVPDATRPFLIKPTNAAAFFRVSQ